MDDDISLKDKINAIYKMQKEKEENQEPKKFRLPFKAKVGKARLKKGYVTTCIVGPNKAVTFAKYPINDNTLKIDGVYHEATAEHILNYKNKPFIIIPSWNEKPFSPSNNFKEASDGKTLTMGQRYILNAFETDAIKPKGKFGGAMIIWILLGIAAGYFVLKQMGAF